MSGYYAETLAGERLRRCYELASPRVQQYLEAEIRYVLGHRRDDRRRPRARLRLRTRRPETGRSGRARRGHRHRGRESRVSPGSSIRGSAASSWRWTPCASPSRTASSMPSCASRTGCAPSGWTRRPCVREALRVTRPGGLVLLSTYADGFWAERLAWFEAQAAAGLIGQIDPSGIGRRRHRHRGRIPRRAPDSGRLQRTLLSPRPRRGPSPKWTGRASSARSSSRARLAAGRRRRPRHGAQSRSPVADSPSSAVTRPRHSTESRGTVEVTSETIAASSPPSRSSRLRTAVENSHLWTLSATNTPRGFAGNVAGGADEAFEVEGPNEGERELARDDEPEDEVVRALAHDDEVRVDRPGLVGQEDAELVHAGRVEHAVVSAHQDRLAFAPPVPGADTSTDRPPRRSIAQIS